MMQPRIWSPTETWLWEHGGRDDRDVLIDRDGSYIEMGIPSGTKGRYIITEKIYLPKEDDLKNKYKTYTQSLD